MRSPFACKLHGGAEHPDEHLIESFVRNLPAADTDSLIDPDQMRGGKQPGPESHIPEDGLKKGTGASFSVCSGYMDNAKMRFRMPQKAEQSSGIVQVILLCKERYAVKI